ncbi:hypothetical protein GN956_G14737 [Arapaima gigas]
MGADSFPNRFHSDRDGQRSSDDVSAALQRVNSFPAQGYNSRAVPGALSQAPHSQTASVSPDRTAHTHTEPLGATRSQMESHGPTWSHLDPHGATWSQMEPHGTAQTDTEPHEAV